MEDSDCNSHFSPQFWSCSILQHIIHVKWISFLFFHDVPWPSLAYRAIWYTDRISVVIRRWFPCIFRTIKASAFSLTSPFCLSFPSSSFSSYHFPFSMPVVGQVLVLELAEVGAAEAWASSHPSSSNSIATVSRTGRPYRQSNCFAASFHSNISRSTLYSKMQNLPEDCFPETHRHPSHDSHALFDFPKSEKTYHAMNGLEPFLCSSSRYRDSNRYSNSCTQVTLERIYTRKSRDCEQPIRKCPRT